MNSAKTYRYASIIIGLVIAVLFILFGFRIVQNVFTRAEDIAPQDVIVSDLSQNTAKITWSTARETQSIIEYGTSPTALNFFSPEGERATAHIVTLTLLSPETTYYFQIRVGEQKFDNGGVPWTFSTKGTGPESQPEVLPTGSSPAGTTSTCSFTSCTDIQAHIGTGCSAADYVRCLQKNVTPSPTLIQAPQITSSL